MPLVSFARDTVTRLRPVLINDGHGNTVPDWSQPPDELAIPGCSVQPAATSEVLTSRDTIQDQWSVFTPRDADVLPTDRLRWIGQDYEVIGQPARWDSPTGALSHQQFLIQRWEG
jgi:hypothetical protein